jgi:N-acetyl-alpha-D-glucosaminyl L-malate synthase BshA
MRIGILCHDSFGGSTQIATELAYGLAQKGHHIHLFAYSPPFGEWVDQDRIRLHSLHPSRPETLHPSSLYINWSTAEIKAIIKNIFQVIAHEGLDILHFHYANPFANIVSEIRHHLGGNKPITVGTLHGTDVTTHNQQQDKKKARLVKALTELDALTTVSLSHAKLSQETFHLSALPIVIPNFVDTTRFHPLNAYKNSLTAVKDHLNNPKIIHISNFRTVKRIEDVAHIFLGLQQRIEAELWLVGDGEALMPVKRFFDTNGISNAVRFWGLQRNITPILNQADLMLITSEYESFCLAALEAMACGVPVLATDVGGLPELVLNGKGGLLFPVGDCDTAVTLAADLLSNPNRHKTMSKAGRRHALTYSFEHIIPQYEVLYQRLLEKA